MDPIIGEYVSAVFMGRSYPRGNLTPTIQDKCKARARELLASMPEKVRDEARSQVAKLESKGVDFRQDGMRQQREKLITEFGGIARRPRWDSKAKAKAKVVRKVLRPASAAIKPTPTSLPVSTSLDIARVNTKVGDSIVIVLDNGFTITISK